MALIPQMNMKKYIPISSDFRELTSFQPKVTCSPSESPEPEKSSVNTVIFEGKSIIATSLASALHPLRKSIAKFKNI
jgi:hypothetical protein